jgi:hypothetical protein
MHIQHLYIIYSAEHNFCNYKKEGTVTVIVHRCSPAFFPDTGTDAQIVNQPITLNPDTCTIFLVLTGGTTFDQFDTLKVTLTGDVQTVDGYHYHEEIEAWIVTGADGGPFEPTNFFRHKDLFEVEEDDDESSD